MMSGDTPTCKKCELYVRRLGTGVFIFLTKSMRVLFIDILYFIGEIAIHSFILKSIRGIIAVSHVFYFNKITFLIKR